MKRVLLLGAIAVLALPAVLFSEPPESEPKKPPPAPATRPAKPKPMSPREAMLRATQLNRQAQALFREGEYAQAGDVCRRALQLPLPERLKASFLYNLACTQARLDKTDEALASLAQAVENGWDDADRMRKDRNLASLRKEAGFAALVKKAGAGVEPTFTRREEVTIVEGKAAGGLHYRIRMAPKANKESPQRLIAWMHPGAGLMNEPIERLAPALNRSGFALIVFERKYSRGWTSPGAARMLKTLKAVGSLAGLDARKPVLFGYSAGGQMALNLWADEPSRFGGLVLDAAYPLDMDAYRRRQMKLMSLPEGEGVKDVPMFVLVGTKDGGTTTWRRAEKEWADTVPLKVVYVEGAGHAWLFSKDKVKTLEEWLKALPPVKEVSSDGPPS